MTDLPGNAQIQSDAVPEPPGSDQPVETPQENTPAPVLTQEQMDVVIGLVREHSRPIAQEVSTAAFRGIQSAQQKFENRVATEIKKLESFGVNATPEMQEQVRKVVASEFAEEPEQPVSQPAAVQQQNQQLHPMVVLANEIMQEYGIGIDQNDPEFASINDQGSNRTFQKTFEAALVAKKARLEKQAAINSPKNIPSAGQRGAPGNPLANITDMDELYKMAAVPKR